MSLTQNSKTNSTQQTDNKSKIINTLDIVFIRHAHRSPITSQALELSKSTLLTPEGVIKATEWGKTLRTSPLFLHSTYTNVYFSGTSILRTHETAKAIQEGAQFTCNIEHAFPTVIGEGFDNILRIRSDGTAWNNKKIINAISLLTKTNTTVMKNITRVCKIYKKTRDLSSIVNDIQKSLNTDNSTLITYLTKYFPNHVATSLSNKIISAFYDLFLDEEESKLYTDTPLQFIKNSMNKTFSLPSQNSNKHSLHIAVTHDFNIGGLVKGIVGIKDKKTNIIQPIQSFKQVGGSPHYLACLLIRIQQDEKKQKIFTVYYNGKKYNLLPHINRLLQSSE